VKAQSAERLVRKFREVDGDGSFVGPPLVAKEGRFQCDLGDRGCADAGFHSTFCDTQIRASNLATVFNEWLARVPGVHARTPRVSFLECSVNVVDGGSLGDTTGVLVEKQLDISKYRKWNDNKGGVDGRDELPLAARARRAVGCRVGRRRRE
jgi:hypothetical protein